MFTGSSDALCLKQISQKKLEFTSLNIEYFPFFTRSSNFLTAYELSVLCYPSLAKLYYALINLDRHFKVAQKAKK